MMQTVKTVRVKVMCMLKVVRQFMKKGEGAALGEYALLLTLITLTLVVSVGVLNVALVAALNGAAAVIAPS
jgi:Flp pilus assembly pilin Flp